jgi:two-component system cell cycle sensor histidine kinase/response regulator CckA
MSDGTERKSAGAALSESEERFQAIFAQAAVGIAQIGLDGKWLLVNSRFCQMLGYSEAELRKKTLQDITHPDDEDESLAGRRQLLAGEVSSHTMEKRYLRRDGAVFWGRLHRSLVRDRDNLPKYFIAVVEDITEKIQAERDLRDSERRLMLAQNAAHLGVWDRDLRKDTIETSGQYSRLYGLPPDHPPLTYDAWLGLIHSEDRERVRELMRDTLKRTHIWDAEFRVVWPDGSVHWLLGKGKVFLDDAGHPVRITGVNIDITERKQSEAALRESEERFRNMADTAPVMIWVAGADKLCTFFNKCCLDFTGQSLEQKIGDGWIAGVHPEDRERLLAKYSSSFDTCQEFQTVFRLRRADGEYRFVLTTGTPRFTPTGVFAGFIGSCVDITELRRTQEEVLSRQKLESLGVLAGGIAHDFNNLLGGILAEAELVEADLAADLSPGEEIARIKAVAIRGAEIVRELMIYAGQDQDSRFEPVDLSRLVEEMLELLKVSVSKQVVLKVSLDKNLPAAWGNAPQIRQVVMNLLINASEAIGEKEGVILVATSRVTEDSDSAVHKAWNLPPGDYVRLKVSDTGSGMSEEAKAKIFDPFFTTKFPGRGLGLAVVQGIVRAHGGAIHLVSAPGDGATFQVLLPCTSKIALEIPSATTSSAAKQTTVRTGTILLVEDEELLRFAVSKALQKKGFSVIEAGDGSAAMDLMRTHLHDLDVILLDVTLPGISSRDILEEAQRTRPSLKVILSSAYDKKTVDASFSGLRITHFIRKPFQLVDLASVLQDALSSTK